MSIEIKSIKSFTSQYHHVAVRIYGQTSIDVLEQVLALENSATGHQPQGDFKFKFNIEQYLGGSTYFTDVNLYTTLEFIKKIQNKEIK